MLQDGEMPTEPNSTPVDSGIIPDELPIATDEDAARFAGDKPSVIDGEPTPGDKPPEVTDPNKTDDDEETVEETEEEKAAREAEEQEASEQARSQLRDTGQIVKQLDDEFRTESEKLKTTGDQKFKEFSRDLGRQTLDVFTKLSSLPEDATPEMVDAVETELGETLLRGITQFSAFTVKHREQVVNLLSGVEAKLLKQVPAYMALKDGFEEFCTDMGFDPNEVRKNPKQLQGVYHQMHRMALSDPKKAKVVTDTVQQIKDKANAASLTEAARRKAAAKPGGTRQAAIPKSKERKDAEEIQKKYGPAFNADPMDLPGFN